MSRKDAVVLASRVLGLLFAVWALYEASFLPERVLALLYYAGRAEQYWSGYEIVVVGFLIIRIVGYSFASRWLLKGGPDIEELLLPMAQDNMGSH